MISRLLSQLAVLSAICTAVLMICPGDAIKKYVRFACSLCVLSVILSFLPFDTSVPQIDSAEVQITDMTDKAAELTVKLTVSSLENAVADLAYQKHNVPKDDIKVSVSYDNDGKTIRLTGVKTELKGLKYAVYTVSLKNDVSELLGVPCEVVIEE